MASRRDRELGMDGRITRRDFFYGSAALLGGAMIGCGPEARETGSGGSATVGSIPTIPDQDYPFDIGPDWYGPGGVGDYASSHGNTPEIIQVAHQVRAGAFDEPPASATDTGETYDLIIVGGGIAGLSAAHHFQRLYPSGRALLLDNHPIFGGEAKRNEIEVSGHRLAAPQGSNDFGVLPETGDPDDYFTSLGMPRSFEYREPQGAGAGLRIPLDNYSFMHWQESQFSVGHHFDRVGWVQDRWDSGLARTPWSEAVRARVAEWRSATPEAHASGGVETWLDGMTMKDYYEGVLGLPPEITAYVDPILASIIGLGCDAISAWWGKHFELPGFGSVDRYADLDIHCFPGGNTGLARYFVKDVIPDAIPGTTALGDVLNGPVAFGELDRRDAPLRMRLGSMVVRVEHEGARSEAETVRVTYVKDGQAYVTRARGVVMASGGWVNRRVLRDLPASHTEAYQSFGHSSVLVANVALTNWRFLARAGVAACMWNGGFGFACNIRRPMVAGGRSAPLDPDQPVVMTFYVPLFFPGRTAREQGILGRTELLTTSFAEYERRTREQMVRLFGDDGFDPRTDIAGIVLNRWGHAYINPGPGFMYGMNGGTAPPDVIREPFGRIAIGHSELRGHQNWTGAAAEGRRAVEALVETVL
jgi:spermidine dehydrogenase